MENPRFIGVQSITISAHFYLNFHYFLNFRVFFKDSWNISSAVKLVLLRMFTVAYIQMVLSHRVFKITFNYSKLIVLELLLLQEIMPVDLIQSRFSYYSCLEKKYIMYQKYKRTNLYFHQHPLQNFHPYKSNFSAPLESKECNVILFAT